MLDFEITRGDLLPVLEGEATGVTSLEGATAEFWFWPANDPDDVTKNPATIVGDGSTNMLRYAWVAGDTDTVGEFRGQFHVTASGGEPFSVPNNRALGWVVLAGPE